jgi:DNA polymerase elongation subunit (family B)
MLAETLTLHSYDWKVKDEYDEHGNMVIHGWCLDRDSNPYLLRFHDFPAYCHIELPLFAGYKRIQWSQYKAQQVFDAICWKMGENKPFKFFYSQKEKLYYYRGGKKYPMMTVLFKNMKCMYDCKNKLSKPFSVNEIGLLACKVWETNISPIRKLLTLRNMKYCQWFTIEGIKVTGEDKVSTLEREYVVDRFKMNPIPLEETSSWVTYPKIMSFDIETYSDRHKALPDSYSSKHVVYMISCVTQRVGDPASKITDIILYGDCKHTDMANIIKVNSEVELIDTLSDLVIKYDPDVLTGYNILGYDNPYLDVRLKRRLREWKPMSRLINEQTKMTSFSWGSSGYGHNEINLLEMDGRIMIDLLPIIRRDYKLPLYNLGFTSNYFLGRTKHPVTAKEMFETYELGQDAKHDPNKPLKEYINEKNALIKSDPDVNNKIQLFEKFHVGQYMNKNDQGITIPDDDMIPNITLQQHAFEEMKKVVEYCVIDSDLVMAMFDKIHCWIGLIEMANVVGVTLVELFTRGQQLRVLSQVYDESAKDQIVIDERIVPKMEYSGGFVYDPVPGIYHYIPCLDFKSLYPTVMISHNIDFRTFVPPEMMDKVPDEMCHVIEWDDDVKKKKDGETEKDDEDEDKDEDKETGEKVHFKFKFIKQEFLLGILPRLLVRLISERDAVRGIQKRYKKNTLEWVVLERRQLALKVSANSMYGALGAQEGGKLPLPEAAACVTAKARESIGKVNKYLESKGHKIVYGDTDSSMPDVGITDPKKAYGMAKEIAKELTALFPAPMQVEDEEVYHTMLCIKKKMYLCVKMTPTGEPILERDQLKIRGVVPARRDNCQYQRDSYLDTAWKILLRRPMMETYDYLVDMCLKLMRREVSWKDLVVIKGLGSHYKNKSYCMKIFSDELCRIGKPAASGDRLEYLIVKTYGVEDTQLLGYKMRLPSTYMERIESDTPERIDYEYYMEKTLMNSIQKQLFQVGYKNELSELDRKYSDRDQTKVINEMIRRGYGLIIDQAMVKFNNDKDRVIKYLMDTDLKKIISPLVSFHIKKRGQVITRVNGEPIKMMVKLIQQKQKCMDSIKSLGSLPEMPKLRTVKQKNNSSDLRITKQGVADKWIKNKTKQMKLTTNKDSLNHTMSGVSNSNLNHSPNHQVRLKINSVASVGQQQNNVLSNHSTKIRNPILNIIE